MQTLDWRDALGESAAPSKRPADRTFDLVTLLGEQGEVAGERSSVRNVLIVTSGDLARRSKSRAAVDLRRGVVVDVDLAAAGEDVDRELLEDWIVKQVVSGSLVRYHAAVRRSAAGAPPSVADSADVDTVGADAAERIARSAFPVASRFDWIDDVDESGEPFKLLGVVSAASPEEIHEAYLAFMRAWVRDVPPERRRRIRVAFRAGVSG